MCRKYSYLIKVIRLELGKCKVVVPCPYCKVWFISKEEQKAYDKINSLNHHISKFHKDQSDGKIVKSQCSKLYKIYKGLEK